MKFVIDCNVLISSAISAGNCRVLLKDILTYHQIVLSEQIIEEYLSVVKRKKFDKYLDLNMAQLKLIVDCATLIKPITKTYNLPDKDDEKYLQTAAAGKAHYLVTGNHKDFPEMIYDEVKIISPKEYIANIL